MLERLARFFPVPVERVAEAFESGVSAARHCAETIMGLRRLGIAHVYLCTLSPRRAATQFGDVMAEVASLKADGT